MIAVATCCGGRFIEVFDQLRDPRVETLHRQRLADHPGGGDRHQLLGQAQGARGQCAAGPGVVEPGLAGAGVGIAAVDQDRLAAPGADPRGSDQNRRGDHLVGGEDAGADRRHRGDDQSQVEFPRLLQPRRPGGELEPLTSSRSSRSMFTPSTRRLPGGPPRWSSRSALSGSKYPGPAPGSRPGLRPVTGRSTSCISCRCRRGRGRCGRPCSRRGSPASAAGPRRRPG